MFFVKLHKCLALFFFVVLMGFLNLFYLRLETLHRHVLMGSFMKKRVENDARKERCENDRDPKIAERNGVVKKHKRIQNRLIKNDFIEIGHLNIVIP